MRKLAVVNFIEAFFSSSLAVALPLYLLHKGINVEEIGIILSISPFVFLIMRTLAAMAAEAAGTRIFFIANSISQVLSSAAYMLASTPFLFWAGKFFEGSAYSFFWAVNRTKVIEREAAREESLAKLLSIRMLAATIGIGAAGLLISISFELLFLLLILAGALSLVTSLLFRSGKPEAKIEPAKMLDPRKKSKKFWKASFAIFFILSAFSIIFSFLFPIYLRSELGMNYENIGALMMFFYFSMAAGSYFAIELGMGGRLVFVFQALAILLIAIIPFIPAYLFPALLLTGFGFGVSFAIDERMIVKVTEGSRYLSTDVALLHVPGRIGEFAALAASGFVLMAYGSQALFIASALLMACFAWFSRDVLG